MFELKKSLALVSALSVGIFTLSAFNTNDEKDIVDIAASNKDFSTLVAAVKAAGLVEALKGDGPFTVFAPTNAAFEKLEKEKPGTIAALLKPENKGLLTQVLTYHVVPGKVMASDVTKLKSGTTVKTLNGQSITVTISEGVKVDNAKVIATDIVGKNGVIHVIDTVIMPSTSSIVDIALADANFSTLVAAVKAAGLVDALKGEGPFTVFAPTNEAFEQLEKEKPGTIASLLKPENKQKLIEILTYHVVPGRVMAADAKALANGTKVATLNGKEISVWNTDGVKINSARVIKADVQATNGVIHVIDTVILP
ncbi:MAG: fasciclin domain-containing protein [Fimbriimonadales bacterium]|nr:fasciclin domain-containing protein [Fimbriimonadales bacterium]